MNGNASQNWPSVFFAIFLRSFIVIVLFCCQDGRVHADSLSGPTVVSTNPPDGTTDVSPDIEWVSITFSEQMGSGVSLSIIGWGRTTGGWSEDGKTYYTSGENAGTPLPRGSMITFILNPADYNPGFQDLEGNPLETYTFSFTIAAGCEILKIPANTHKGFDWPYYLSIPHRLNTTSVLLVEPNNTGTGDDDHSVHDKSAQDLIRRRLTFAVDLNVPLLVPTFPRPSSNWHIYTHALDRDSIITDVQGLQRIDLQLIAMINDAKERLSSMGIDVADKVFLNGYSASGSFVNRFTILHPEIVMAAAMGSPGGWPTVPIGEWEGRRLRYPVGVADLEELIGTGFNIDAFRSVPQYIYIGNHDSNDAVPFSDGFDPEDRDLIYELFGSPAYKPWWRWPKAAAIFNSVQSSSQFVVYPDVGHTCTPEIWDNLQSFFETHTTDFHGPRLAITANYQGGTVRIIPGMSVSIAVSLSPGNLGGQDAEWWICAFTAFGWYSYVYSTGWEPGIVRAMATPLVGFPSTQVLDITLPAGEYTFFFAVDDNADGLPDGTWLDSVTVYVSNS